MDNIVDAEDGEEVIVSIRPEEFVVLEDKNGEGLPGTVAYSTFLGLNTHYFIDLAGGKRIEVIQELTIDEIVKKGTPVRLGVKKEKINVFTRDGMRSIVR